MQVTKIVYNFLKENGFDGLFAPERCSCKLDDLMPCCEYYEDCEAGFLIPRDSEDFNPEFDFMIGPDKTQPAAGTNDR